MKEIIFTFMLLLEFTMAKDYFYKDDKKIVIEKVGMSNIKNIEYYKTEEGIFLGISDKIIVKMKDIDFLEKYIQKYNISMQKKISKNLYLIQVKDRSKTLHVANELHEEEDVEYAQPDFIKKRILR